MRFTFTWFLLVMVIGIGFLMMTKEGELKGAAELISQSHVSISGRLQVLHYLSS